MFNFHFHFIKLKVYRCTAMTIYCEKSPCAQNSPTVRCYIPRVSMQLFVGDQ